MNVRKRILLLASLLLLVSVGGIGNIVWQLSYIERMQNPTAVLHCLILLGLFGTGLIFSILELVRHEIMSPIFQLAAQVARLKEREIDGHRLELTGSKDIDLLTRAFNDLLDGFEKDENLYRIFTEMSPDMIFLLDRDGRVLFGNLNTARQWNYQTEEIIGKRQEELFPPDIAVRHKQVIQKIFETGQPISLDVHESIGHHQCWIDARMVPVLNKDGRVTAVLGISRDITECKQIEETLKRSEKQLHEVSTRVPGVVYQFYARPNGEWGFYYISDRSEQIIGLKPDLEGYLERFIALVIPEHRNGFIKSIEKSVKELSEWEYEGILQKPSGEKIWFSGNSTLSSRENEIIFNGIVQDITKRKQVEAKAAMLASAIENAHHGCLIVSEDYKVGFSNNYALTKLGFESDELKNLDLFSLCADREQVNDIIETMKVTKRWMGEIAIIKKDGGQFPALVSVTALDVDDDASGRGGDVILFQDITIQKEMREKLLTSEKLAVMGRLVADVAHELNNPLAIVIGGTQLVLSRIDEKPQEVKFKSQLETVLRNARRCKTILSNLLGYGRTIGKKEEAVNLPDLIREAIDDVNYQYDMSAIETVLNYPGFVKGSAEASSELAVAEITGNRSALLSVFVNLIRNARQAMGEKGRLTIIIEKEDKKHLRIEIHDTGLGMSKEQKTKLFKPFTSGWKEAEGSGLGLATSLGIIETHGGSMSATSEGVGKGATFTILLPCEFKVKK